MRQPLYWLPGLNRRKLLRNNHEVGLINWELFDWGKNSTLWIPLSNYWQQLKLYWETNDNVKTILSQRAFQKDCPISGALVSPDLHDTQLSNKWVHNIRKVTTSSPTVTNLAGLKMLKVKMVFLIWPIHFSNFFWTAQWRRNFRHQTQKSMMLNCLWWNFCNWKVISYSKGKNDLSIINQLHWYN